MPEGAIGFIEGADKLTVLYGYWITFHDAAVETVLIERSGPTVTICFTTNDAISADGGETFQFEKSCLARVVMRWHEVRDLVLSGIDWDESNWIDGLEFVRSGNSVCTVIERMHGTHGFILARRVEVVSVDVVETREAATSASASLPGETAAA